jgi:predicted nucleic acid-binding protein
MMRVFVDTNIYVSALIFGGKPRVALQSIDSTGIELIATAELRSELHETLTGEI